MKQFLFILLSIIITLSSDAVPIQFFGEDWSDDTPLTTFPNANGAREQFQNHLSNPAFYDFEMGSGGRIDRDHFQWDFAFSDARLGMIIEGVWPNPSVLSEGGRFGPYLDSSSHRLVFTEPVSAFGFYIADLGDTGGRLNLELKTANDNDLFVSVPNRWNNGIEEQDPRDDSMFFYGWSDPDQLLTSIGLFSTSNHDDRFGFDEVIIQGIPTVPDQGGMVAFTLLLITLLYVSWRKYEKR